MRENRLASESSPYLLQHRHNPVDWFPWGDEAFELARSGDRPVFLSIGYATCHWCHVMERESFEDEEVARLMNQYFVSVKVDREERPDVDHVYMTACQIAGVRGGWPLTALLTPDRHPFFVATYIPRESRGGRPGMLDLIPRVGELWATERERILASAEELSTALRSISLPAPGDARIDLLPGMVARALEAAFDERYGGFGDAPKFPSAHNMILLSERARGHTGDRGLEIVDRTLDSIRRGGIYDHVGFGVHRYATDAAWELPHFEKMLYDQAMLCLAATTAYSVDRKPEHLALAREVSMYVRRDLTSGEGAFYAAEDADSEGEEGLFYTWEYDELQRVLGDSLDAFATTYDVRREGNYRDEATGERSGRNVIRIRAGAPTQSSGAGRNRLDLLLNERGDRVRPLLDDKILVDWNGLAIAALARLGAVSGDSQSLDAAKRAADFLLRTMRVGDGDLLHRYRKGVAGVAGMLDDYAFLTWGLLELYNATGDVEWLGTAVDIAEAQVRRFGDSDHGGFFFGNDADELIVRTKEMADGAYPSGNSVSALNFARLFAFTADVRYRDLATSTLAASYAAAERYPLAFGAAALAAEVLTSDTVEVVIAADGVDERVRNMHAAVVSSGSWKVSCILKTAENAAMLSQLCPYASDMSAAAEPRAYLCSDGACDLPTDEEGLYDALAGRVAGWKRP